VATLLFSVAAQAGGAALAQPGPLRLSPAGIAGIAGGVLLALYLRVADDLKDWETDRELAAAGDARFAGRPQTTREVEERDLRRLALVIAAIFGLLLAPQPPAATVLGGLSFVGAWLAARWFFYPAMAASLPLAFVTHNPLALLFLSFGVAVGAGVGAASLPVAAAAALLVGLYLPIAAWEIARKVRTPEEETAYVTWSKVMGWRMASAVPPALTVGSAALLAFAAAEAGLGRGCGLLLAVAALGPIAAAAAFRLRPSPAGARRLRPAIEGYSAVAGLGLVIFAVVARGVVLG
jgi:4-hydroxybenzoate polyprenyltransferase